jgi:hypothetical protein
MLDQVGADVAEQPTRKWTLRPMADYHEVGVDLASDLGDYLAGISRAQPRRRREAHSF